MQKEYSVSDVLFSVVLSVVVAFSAGLIIDNKIIIADSDDVLILDDLISESDRSTSEDIAFSGSVSSKQTLDCYPQINETSLGEYGNPRKGTEFSCGELKFLISSFSQEEADIVLGGYFPVTKTLSQIGCKLEGEVLLCREEELFKVKGSELKAYREIVAHLISTPSK